jgi:DNA-binding response OmpR family regulator
MSHACRPAVLVVDARVEWAREVMSALRPAGYRVDWTSDLGMAIEWLEEAGHAVAIVGSDPDWLDATDVIATLRMRQPRLRVLLAADAARDGEREAELAGALPVPRRLTRDAWRTLVDVCVARPD